MKIKSGGVVAALGAFVLGVVLVVTALSAMGHKEACPPDKPVLPADGMLFSPDDRFGVNDKLCLAWRPKVYFAKELGDVALRDKAKAAEEAAIEAVAKSATAPEKATAEAVRKTAEVNRIAAEAKVAALPAVVEPVLFIDDVATANLHKRRMPVAADPDWVWETIQFRAPENYASKEAQAWRKILGGVSRQGSRQVRVGLGDAGETLPRKGAEIGNLEVSAFEWQWLAAGAAGFAVAMFGLGMIGWNTGMLRIRSPKTAADKPPFSLARVQMAWWFMLTLAGFLFIWLTTGQWMGVMTSSVVGLLGISGISGLAAVAIDADPKTAAPGAVNAKSKGFFTDILSDGDSIVLHRLQMVAWTVILGLIFAWSVAWSYAFPAFDPTLLVLAGVVNGVYLGFKFPENK